MKKLAAVLALVLTSFVVAPGLVAPANAADDDYTSAVRTSCHLAVPAVIRVNHAPHIRIYVQPNGPAPAAGTKAAQRAAVPTGTVSVSITRSGTPIFSRTVAYNGRQVTVVGPVITQPGHYVVHGQFRSDDGSVFRSCQGSTAFDIRKGSGPDHNNPPPNGGNNPPGGLLPDTGGPNVWWLVLALSTIAAGGGLVVAAKRRPPRPLYDL